MVAMECCSMTPRHLMLIEQCREIRSKATPRLVRRRAQNRHSDLNEGPGASDEKRIRRYQHSIRAIRVAPYRHAPKWTRLISPKLNSG